jgi:hypothetical protein
VRFTIDHRRIVLAALASLFLWQSPVAADAAQFDQAVLDRIAAMRHASNENDSSSAVAAFSDIAVHDAEALYCHHSLGLGFEGYLIRLLDRELHPNAYVTSDHPRDFSALNSVLSQESELEALHERGILFAEVEAFYDATDDLDATVDLSPERIDLRLLRARTRIELIDGVRPFTGDIERLRGYLDQELLVEDLRLALASENHGLLASLTIAELADYLAYDDEIADEMNEISLAAYDDAVDLLPAWSKSHIYPMLHYLVLSGRATVHMQMGNLDAFDTDIFRAIDGPDFDLMGARCPNFPD